MAYEMKDNSGSLWKNLKKEKESHADYTGNVMINGTEYWLKGWVNETNDGRKYFGLTFTAKDAPKEQRTAPAKVHDDDEIPF